jgi:hypothetical protein
MSLNDHPNGATGRTDRRPATRPDVLTARSRMRTKYGAQREIEQVASALEPGEVLLHLAVTRGSARTGRSAHGLLALTDLRLQYVPKASAPAEPQTIALAEIGMITWSPDGDPATGTLSVVSSSGTCAYAGLSRADGRDLVAGIRRVRPAVDFRETVT